MTNIKFTLPLQMLWRFVWHRIPLEDFEAWLYRDGDVEALLGDETYLTLIELNYRDREAVRGARTTMLQHLMEHHPGSWFEHAGLAAQLNAARRPLDFSDEPDPLPKTELGFFLMRHLPSVREAYFTYVNDLYDGDPWNANVYGVIANVLADPLRDAVSRDDQALIKSLAATIDWLFEHGDAAIKNEVGLVFVVEWSETGRHGDVLGPAVRAAR